jgi:hypothetical protein
MDLFLIPVRDALPALEEYMDRDPEAPSTPEEEREMDMLTLRFLAVAEQLAHFVKAVGGKLARN